MIKKALLNVIVSIMLIPTGQIYAVGQCAHCPQCECSSCDCDNGNHCDHC